MASDPNTRPPMVIAGDEIFKLSGISSRKEMASMTPAAKQSMLQIYPKVGIFRTPIAEPIIGPETDKATIQIKGSMMNIGERSSLLLTLARPHYELVNTFFDLCDLKTIHS